MLAVYQAPEETLTNSLGLNFERDGKGYKKEEIVDPWIYALVRRRPQQETSCTSP